MAINVGTILVGLGLDPREFNKAGSIVERSASRMGKGVVVATAAAAAGVAYFGARSIKASAEFNKAMTESTAIMGDLSKAIRGDMVEATREMARSTTFGAEEGAKAFFYLASAGLDAVASIEALPQVAKFAQAGAFDLARATDLLTDAQSALGLTIRDDAVANMLEMARVSDVLVRANTLANASVEQFSTSLTTKAGAALKILGKDVEEGVAVLAAFADQGVKAQEAGTALNIVLRDLSTKALENSAAFAENRVRVFDAAGEMRNIGDIVADLENRLEGMSDAQAKATLRQLGFADKSVIFLQTLIGMSEQIRTYEAELRNAAGTTEEVAQKQLLDFSAQAKLAANEVNLLQIALGDMVTQNQVVMTAIQGFTSMTRELTDSANENREAWDDLVNLGLFGVLRTIEQTVMVFGRLVQALGLVTTGIGYLLGAVVKLGRGILAASTWLGKFIPGLSGLRQEILEGADTIAAFTDEIRDGGKIVLEAGSEMVEGSRRIGESIDGLVDKTQGIAPPAEEAAASLSDVRAAAKEAGEAADLAGDGFAGLSDKTKKAAVQARSLASTYEEVAKEIQRSLPGRGSRRDVELAVPLPPTGAVGELLRDVQEGIDRTHRWEEAQKAYNAEVSRAADLIQILPGPLGEVVSLTTSAAAALKSLKDLGGAGGILGGIKDAFKAGSAGGGILGLLGGVSAVAGLAGPIIGLGTEIVKGIAKIFKSGPDLIRDAARDLGATITKDMAAEAERTGKPLQLAIASFWEQGAFSSIDVFAREAGDVFSGIEQGAFAAQEGMATLGQSVPILTSNITSMGEEGVLQLERILSAAATTGQSFEGMDQLAAAYVQRARELGIAVNNVTLEALGLQDVLSDPTAPATVEEIAKRFKLSNDQVRELASLTQTTVQTNLERMAANANLSVGEFRELAEILKRDMNVSLEEIGPLLQAMGGDARTLAESLGIDVTSGAGTAQDELVGANQELLAGVSYSADLAENLRQAALHSHNIVAPRGAAPGAGVPHAAEGLFVPATPGGQPVIVGEGGEAEFIIPESKMGRMGLGGGGRFELDVNVHGDSLSPEESIRFREQLVPVFGAIMRQAIRDGELNDLDFEKVT